MLRKARKSSFVSNGSGHWDSLGRSLPLHLHTQKESSFFFFNKNQHEMMAEAASGPGPASHTSDSNDFSCGADEIGCLLGARLQGEGSN